MKHKGERNIPDFSKKPKGPRPGQGVPERHNEATPAPPARAPQAKPQATSRKSGQRGQ
jgi:hypothetical protein